MPRQFFLENRGRKPMKIIWARQKKLEKKPKPGEETKGDESAKKSSPTKSPALPGQEESKQEEQFVFTIVPTEITLNPRMGIMVEFRANSFNIGKISEPWQC